MPNIARLATMILVLVGDQQLSSHLPSVPARSGS